MNVIRGLVLLALATPVTSYANDYPTADRVEYVLECMRAHGGKQEYLYKCSCAIDQVAKKLKYEQYVEASTAQRHQSLGGERGAVFRDPPNVKKAAKSYKAIDDAAQAACFIG